MDILDAENRRVQTEQDGKHDEREAVQERNGSDSEYVVRRLTPTECQFLQGFPGVASLSDDATRDEVAAVAIATGTIAADVKTGKVYRMRGPGGLVLKEPIEVKGSEQSGYLVCRVSAFGQKRQIRMHRLVWMMGNGMIPEGMVVDHINNDKKDNRLENLQLLTPKENSRKAYEDGLYRCKEDNGRAKITNEEHDLIQHLYWGRKKTCRELAADFGISDSRVQQIIHESTWCSDIPHSDSAEYKMWGNGIALPCILPMMKAMADVLKKENEHGELRSERELH